MVRNGTIPYAVSRYRSHSRSHVMIYNYLTNFIPVQHFVEGMSDAHTQSQPSHRRA